MKIIPYIMAKKLLNFHKLGFLRKKPDIKLSNVVQEEKLSIHVDSIPD